MVRIKIADQVKLRPREDAKQRMGALLPQAEDLQSHCHGAREHIRRLTQDLLGVRANLVLAKSMLGRIPVCSDSGTGGMRGFLVDFKALENSLRGIVHIGPMPRDPVEKFKAVMAYERVLDARIREIDQVLSTAETIAVTNVVKVRGINSEVNRLGTALEQEHANISVTKPGLVAAAVVALGVVQETVVGMFNSADTLTITGGKVFASLLLGAAAFYLMLRHNISEGAEKIEKSRSMAEASLNMVDFKATSDHILTALGTLRKNMEQTVEHCSQGVKELIESADSLVNVRRVGLEHSNS